MELQAKNLMLQALVDYAPAGSSTFLLGIFEADADQAVINMKPIVYGSVSNAKIEMLEDVILEVPAGTTVSHFRIVKSAGGMGVLFPIYKRDIEPEVFTNDGEFVFEKATIEIGDCND